MRIGITRACVVADRGMISSDTIAALEALGMEYIPSVRERTSRVIRDVVLNDMASIVPLALDRQHGDTQLWVKEVWIGKGKAAQRYIVPVNEAEAEKDRDDRQAIVDGLQAQLKKGAGVRWEFSPGNGPPASLAFPAQCARPHRQEQP
ncbi:hypothetical protein Acry_3431 (plasmid) [Acidiphilium cryptum JF-5]|uniref:Transposase IS4-like domain-containing protein n=1 Tax=Acidiphilium cryptum (strain JF-5) TaxID=349163 RepID=A5FTV4_ACICJ|nr:hypothetical protein Acry_3431 [Acidiphilium cryptum JF-5]